MFKAFTRYLLVQVGAYGIDMGLFLALSMLFGTGALAANIASKLAAGTFAFIGHRSFTFGAHGRGDGRAQLLKYGLLLAANVPLGTALLALLLNRFQPPALAKVLSDVACVAFTFAISRNVVFRPSSGRAP